MSNAPQVMIHSEAENTDYSSGDVTTYALHIRGPANAIRRLRAALKSKKKVRFH